MSPKITKRNSERVAACFTCPLCNKLFKDPTTICECVHTFCQKCIMEKLIEERLHNCPLCSAELGGAPLNKLRADHSLEYMMPRVFRKKPTPSLKATQPSKKKKSKSRRKNPSPQKLTAARAYSRKRSKNPAQPESSTNLVEDSHKGSKSPGKNLTSSESTIPIEDTNPGETLRDRRQISIKEPQPEIPNNLSPLDARDNGASKSISQSNAKSVSIDASEKNHSTLFSTEISTDPPRFNFGKSSSTVNNLNSRETRGNLAYTRKNSSSILNSSASLPPLGRDCSSNVLDKLIANRKLKSKEVNGNLSNLGHLGGVGSSTYMDLLNSQETSAANSTPLSLDGDSSNSLHLDIGDGSLSYMDLLNSPSDNSRPVSLNADSIKRDSQVSSGKKVHIDRDESPSNLLKSNSQKTSANLASGSSIKLHKLNSRETSAILARFTRGGNSSKSSQEINVTEKEPVVDVHEEISNRMNKLNIRETVYRDGPPGTSSELNRGLGGDRQKQAAAPEGQNTSAQATADVNRTSVGKPVWFSLVPAPSTKGGRPFPKIISPYLRVMDGNMPVSFVEKYVAKKLGLPNESLVQITVRGHPVIPTVSLLQVEHLWVCSTPHSERKQPKVGESGKDFMMVLSYTRRAKPNATT